MMKVTLDMNVLYQALRGRTGASHFILTLIRNEDVGLAISVPVFLEYSDVLHRQKSLLDLDLSRDDVEAVLRFISLIGDSFSISFSMRPNLTDEADNMYVELAFSSNSEYLITSNISDFSQGTELIFDSFQVITPSDFVSMWRARS